MSGLAAAAAGMIGNGILGLMNNAMAKDMASQDRKENYMYNQLAAKNADERTRLLYNDLYSPKALLKQYQEAGLSPSLMFGGTPGGGGTQAAIGNGPSGIQTPFMPISLLEAAQAAQLFAQTKKTNAETKNIEKDTELKDLEKEYQNLINLAKNLENQEQKAVYNLTMSYITSETGEYNTSLFEIAQEAYNYEDFMKKARTAYEKGNMQQELMILGTEKGQEVMRRIFVNANRMDRDIKVLSEEGANAVLQEKIVNFLNNSEYAKLNANTAVEQLKQMGEEAKLSGQQAEAWNNLIERLKKTNGTMADIAIVLGMICNRFISSVGIKINTGK